MKLFNFKNLILLMGTNPLPNYVTADYFLQKNKNIQKIWLFYSKENEFQGGTLAYAKNIEETLTRKWEKNRPDMKFPLEKIGLSDVSRAIAIQNDINQSRLKEEIEETSFHLNYTGGTKSMSTHVYLTLNKMIESDKIFFSYLDARNFSLITDHDNQIVERDLRKIVSIQFENMIRLHGFKLIKEKKMPDDVSQEMQLFNEFINPNITKEEIKKIKEKNGGQWLEAVIAKKLKNITKDRTEEDIEIKMGININHPSWIGGRSNFEIDLIMVYGYQLIGISCYIGEKTEKCKQKGFEIILRTRQIGGDESKSVLITGSDKHQTKLLQQQLIIDTGGNKKNIKVFGIEDLRRDGYLIKELKRFIFT